MFSAKPSVPAQKPKRKAVFLIAQILLPTSAFCGIIILFI